MRVYLTGKDHPFFGKKHTEATKQKMREAAFGDRNPMFGKPSPCGMLGKHPTVETREKMRKAHTGMVASDEACANMSKAQLGHPTSDETRDKISVSLSGENSPNFGKPLSVERIKRLSEARFGKNNPFYGKHHSEETKQMLRGENSTNWRGGISFEPYSLAWTKELKQSIRERDGYTCQLCGVKQGDEALHVHHIDYDKKNCDPLNLTALCQSCHSKTTSYREFWTELFQYVRKAA
jgi:5-methylcytosine-specific restriction endonuclease McrA